MAQDNYLTHRQIIDYLCDIERNLPPSEYRIYVPSVSGVTCPISQERLHNECKRMMEFVGLRDYAIDVQFETLDNNVGGTIELKGGGEELLNYRVKIRVSQAMDRDWKATVATLAHEICHKLLYINRLQRFDTQKNEIYTDLCTLYVGFGEAILAGYDTSTSTLGYLDMNNYRTAQHIMAVVRAGCKSDFTNLHGIDGFVSEGIDLLEKWSDIETAKNECFKESSKNLAIANRNLQLLEQMITKCREDVKMRYQKLNDAFYEGTQRDGKTLPIAAFRQVCSTAMENWDADIYEDPYHSYPMALASSEALFHIFIEYQKSGAGVMQFNYNTVRCPHCGKTRVLSKKPDSLLSSFKCPDCGRYFSVDHREWTPTKVQRTVEARRREALKAEREQLQKQKDALEAQYHKQRSELQADFENKKQAFIANQKTIFLSHLPAWLRFLVAKRIEKIEL